MRKLLTLLFLVVLCTSVRAQINSLPTIDDPQDADRIDTYTRGFAAAFRLDTLKSYFQEGGKFIDTVTVDATGDTLIFSFTDGTEFRLGGVQGEDGQDGTNGQGGIGVTNTSYNAANGTVTFTYSDASTFTTGDLRGEDGPQGDPATDDQDLENVLIQGNDANGQNLLDVGFISINKSSVGSKVNLFANSSSVDNLIRFNSATTNYEFTGGIEILESSGVFGTSGNYGARIYYDGANNLLRFKTANQTSVIEPMTIRRDGGVGFNKTNPSYEVDVGGTVRADDFIGDGSALTNIPYNGPWSISGTKVYLSDGKLGVNVTPTDDFEVRPDNNQNLSASFHSGTTFDDKAFVDIFNNASAAGGAKLRIYSGIDGSTAARHGIDFSDAGTENNMFSIIHRNSDGTDGSLSIETRGDRLLGFDTDGQWLLPDDQLVMNATNKAYKATFGSASVNDANANFFIENNSTAAGRASLNIAGLLSSDFQNAGGRAGIKFYRKDTGTDANPGLLWSIQTLMDDGDFKITRFEEGNTNSFNTVLHANIDDGFVGINTNTPSFNLDVNGTLRASSLRGDGVNLENTGIYGGDGTVPLNTRASGQSYPGSAVGDTRLEFGKFYQSGYNNRFYALDRIGYGIDLKAKINGSGDLIESYLTINDRSQFGGLQYTGKDILSLASSGFAVRGFSWEGGVFDYVFGPNAADRYQLGVLERPQDGTSVLATNKDGETVWNQAEMIYDLRFDQAVGTFPAGGWSTLNLGSVELEDGGVYEFEITSYHFTNNASTAQTRFVVSSGSVSGRYVDGIEGQTTDFNSISLTPFSFPGSTNNTEPRRDVVTGYFTASGNGLLTLQGRGVSDTASFAAGTNMKIKQIR